jgi:LuxR family maltose regulon positive regulatory protein
VKRGALLTERGARDGVLLELLAGTRYGTTQDPPAPFTERGPRRADVHGSPAGRGLVRRSLLLARLSATPPGGVAVVCAPAGSGKSVLVRLWSDADGVPDRVAWVSVERGERDAQRFWLSVVDALSRAVALVDPAPATAGFRGEPAVARLLSQLGGLAEPVTVVIDDLHELRSTEALAWLELFLAGLPPTVRAVLATRADPRLGLHRLRLAGQLIELRAADLSFTLDETRALLDAADINISDAGVRLLHERAEGWAAGLRMAVISLARHPEPERFVREFSGSERTVAGYLLAEVLERQPAEVRELLLRTSILDRVSGPLADFMTGATGSERILQALEDANAFVSALDAGRTWFRYHQLFADLLQLELRRVSPTLPGSLHRAAAQWHEEHGDALEAVRHAQAAGAWSGAARLLADNYVELILDGRTDALRERLSEFPPDAPGTDAEVAAMFASVRVVDGSLEEASSYIELARSLADTVPAERARRFELLLAVARLALAHRRGDLETAVEVQRAVEAGLAGEPRRDELRAVALMDLGVAELWSSQVDDARRDLEHALALARRAGRPFLEVACLGHLAIAGAWAGLPFSEGLQLSEEAVRIADAHNWGDDRVIGAGLATGAMALVWLGRFEEAERWLERGRLALQPDGDPGAELILHDARGLLRAAQGRLEEALAAFCSAERMQALLVDEHLFAVPARARLMQTQARSGQSAAAAAALADFSPSERDRPSMRVTAAAVQLAQGHADQAVDVLAPLIGLEPQELRPRWSIVEAVLFDAAARDQLGDRRAAEASLEQALELAEPEGLVLPFLLAPVGRLLERLPRHQTAHATLLRTILDVRRGSSAPPAGAPGPLTEELSEAELRVLRFLPSNLKAPEIAAELCVSANTVRTHVRHIYAKLDAHDRNEAVDRARDLALLAPSVQRRPAR